MKKNKKNIAAEAEQETKETVSAEAVNEEAKDAAKEEAAEAAEATEKVEEAAEAAEEAGSEEKSSDEAENTEASEEKEEKKKSKKPLIITACIVAALVVLGALAAVFGGKLFGGEGGFGGEANEGGEKVTYSVSIETIGGMALSEIDVYVYADNTLADMKDLAKTNSEGKVTFNLPEKEGYAIVLASVAKGYAVEESYAFD